MVKGSIIGSSRGASFTNMCKSCGCMKHVEFGTGVARDSRQFVELPLVDDSRETVEALRVSPNDALICWFTELVENVACGVANVTCGRAEVASEVPLADESRETLRSSPSDERDIELSERSSGMPSVKFPQSN